MQTIPSREFHQNLAAAKQAAEHGPVIVTDRGRPTHVLLRYEDFRRMAGGDISIADALDDPDTEDLDFDPPPLGLTVHPAAFDER
ncbi:type II toxin-antitoxin system Phd/YefM family antitoxin [Azospirillum sp. ST 5-10]|uniref:type II toxin-antitoxin system Phd/YefM family antitoxin n=1 Tax=unclassified Azospirillum TaxID=2630922 RepID=UPI003F4A6F05